MRYLLRSFVVLMLIALATPAHAYYFQWRDPGSGMTLNIPDTWKRVINENSADIMTYRAPGQNQFAGCRISVNEDKRFSVYPEGVSDHVQKVYFDYGFWEQHALTQYKYFKLHDIAQNRGLGHGFATLADVSYVPYGIPKHMRTLMSASHYNNKTYILGCFAETSAFYEWYETFQTILASVRFDKQIHELPGGDYRNFLNDDILRVHTINGQSSNH